MSMNMNATSVLIVLFLFVVGLTLLCIIVPLILTAKKVNLEGSLPFFVFFASIGLGFMLVEISQMQRLIIFLGHPVYSLSVVLFSLLLGSGLGSFLTHRLRNWGMPRNLILPFAGLLAGLIVFDIVTLYFIKELESSSTFIRVLASTAMLLPLGITLGMPFPIGMRLATMTVGNITPWLWGINGATSVCASVLAVVIAMTAGISTSYWAGFFSYTIAFLAILYCVLHHTATSGERLISSNEF